MNIENAKILSPKRSRQTRAGWQGYFPYYAGFPDVFAQEFLASLRMPASSVVLDPWNGSGTTTFSATCLGLRSVGVDINPVMSVVARARLLAATEADSMLPLCKRTIESFIYSDITLDSKDPLLNWFDEYSAAVIRRLERSIADILVGNLVESGETVRLEFLSCLAASFYVSLFSAVADLAASFIGSNPTWVRLPRANELKIRITSERLTKSFRDRIASMAEFLHAKRNGSTSLLVSELAKILVGDSRSDYTPDGSVDIVITSPPYCTRIDYFVKTRIQMAVMWPLTRVDTDSLRRDLLGSTFMPLQEVQRSDRWGKTCNQLLDAIRAHPSKSSKTYYYQTHADYFEKLHSSLKVISKKVRHLGAVCIVAQDSYYKELRNDLPLIITEMGTSLGLELRRKEDFSVSWTLANCHPHAKRYGSRSGATESVLCFLNLNESRQIRES